MTNKHNNSDENKINQLKQSFNEVDIPQELDQVINNSIRKGKKDMKKRTIKRRFIAVASSIVAVFAIFTISFHAFPAFADSLANVPIVGNFVKELRLDKGSDTGGQITDGTEVQIGDLDKQGEQEILTVNFNFEGTPTDMATFFEVAYNDYPHSMLFTIPGARYFSQGDVFSQLEDSKLVSDIYRLITLDDSMQRFVVTFTKPVDFEIYELANPAQIVLTLKEKQQPEKLQPVYSLRSGSYPFGETIGVIEGILRYEIMANNVRMLKDEMGTYIVEEGYYHSEEEALARLKELQELGVDFHVEKRESADIPRAINP